MPTSTKSSKSNRGAPTKPSRGKNNRSSGNGRHRQLSTLGRLQQVAVATLGAAALLLLMPLLVENANPWLDEARGALQSQLGLGAYILPLLLIVLAFLLSVSLRRRGFRLQWPQAVGWLAFFVGLLGLLSWLQALGVWAPADNASGTFGRAAYRALLDLFGQAGSALVLLLLCLGGLTAGLGVAMRRVWASVRALARTGTRMGRWLRKRALPFLQRAARLSTILLRRTWLGLRRGALHLWARGRSAAKQQLLRWRAWRQSQAKAGPAGEAQLPAVASGEDDKETATKAAAGRASKSKPAPVSSGDELPRPVPGGAWQLPPLTLLEATVESEGTPADDEERFRAIERTIEKTLSDFGVPVKVVERRPGPTVTQFGVEPMFHEKRARDGTLLRREKVKVREITSRATDLSLALAARSIRIEAPVPGRSVVGIEVPNQAAAMVSLRGELENRNFQRALVKSALPIVLGRDVSGEVVVGDLAKMPHLLIAGATGSGKSVCINSIIATLLMNHPPDYLRFLMIDPKRVELALFDSIPHLLRPVVVDVEKAVPTLIQAVAEMDKRYRAFQAFGVRNIEGYNRVVARDGGRPRLPYMVLMIDELADLMMLASDEVERTLCRLAQLARATGIHLVVATQRPSVDIVTGLIKANFPTRISFMVMSQVDSRTILDMGGAEKLLGRGDMLYLPSDAPKPLRLQGTFVSDKEIEDVTGFWRAQRSTEYVSDFVDLPTWSPGGGDGQDELYEQAVALTREHSGRVSVSFLQRRLRIGWNRAARLMEMLEENGELPGAPANGDVEEPASAAEDA
ncbi:MAG: DNA translocase FtsK [Chloroflexi bacterium]|nr:DNA translocase FtsK [Chloroflexota bacterium]MCL5108140.1 DNA translocase FtsK [Chloroflexota bacterium]